MEEDEESDEEEKRFWVQCEACDKRTVTVTLTLTLTLTPLLTGTHHWWSGAEAVRTKVGYRVRFLCLYAFRSIQFNE